MYLFESSMVWYVQIHMFWQQNCIFFSAFLCELISVFVSVNVYVCFYFIYRSGCVQFFSMSTIDVSIILSAWLL